MAKKHCLVPLLFSQRIRCVPTLHPSRRPHGSTLGRAVVHLLFPRHRVDAPHETRVRLATVLLHFCLSILRSWSLPASLLLSLPSRSRVRARFCRMNTRPFSALHDRKNEKFFPRAHRAVREVAHSKRAADGNKSPVPRPLFLSIRRFCVLPFTPGDHFEKRNDVSTFFSDFASRFPR